MSPPPPSSCRSNFHFGFRVRVGMKAMPAVLPFNEYAYFVWTCSRVESDVSLAFRINWNAVIYARGCLEVGGIACARLSKYKISVVVHNNNFRSIFLVAFRSLRFSFLGLLFMFTDFSRLPRKSCEFVFSSLTLSLALSATLHIPGHLSFCYCDNVTLAFGTCTKVAQSVFVGVVFVVAATTTR